MEETFEVDLEDTLELGGQVPGAAGVEDSEKFLGLSIMLLLVTSDGCGVPSPPSLGLPDLFFLYTLTTCSSSPSPAVSTTSCPGTTVSAPKPWMLGEEGEISTSVLESSCCIISENILT